MNLARILGAALALVAATFVGWAWYIASESDKYVAGPLGAALTRDLGFAHGSPYIRLGESRREVFTLHAVPGGIMDRAGVRGGDMPRDFSITGFYKHLQQHRGSEVSFDVVDGGDGPPENQRAVRRISLRVAPAK